MKYDKEHIDIIIQTLQEGRGRVVACLEADITYNTFLTWMDRADFSDLIRKAENEYNYQKISNGQRKYQERKSKNPTSKQKQNETWHGYSYIYIVHQDDTNFYKIGVSKIKPHLRLSQLQTGNPFKLSIIHIFRTEKPYTIEKALQKQLHKYRSGREWFKFNGGQLSKIIDIIDSEINKVKFSQLTINFN